MAPCGVVIDKVICKFPECPLGTNNGSIIITAYSEYKQILEYSIDGGLNYFEESTFNNLQPGMYEVIVRPVINPACALTYGVVELPSPLCIEQCEEIDETCGTLLYPGDITFSAFDNNIHFGNDRISVTTLVDIKPYTGFTIANVIYEGGAVAGQRTDKWQASGNNPPGEIASHKIVYIGKNGFGSIPAGSTICFDLPSHDSGTGMLAQNFKINGFFSSAFCVSDNGNTSLPRVNINCRLPDALFLLQGTWTFESDHATLCGRVISGIQTGANWFTLSDGVPLPSRISRLHPQLACLSIQSTATPQNTATWFSPLSSSYTPLGYLEQVTNTVLWTNAPKPTGKNDLPVKVCMEKFDVVEGGKV